MVAGLFAKWQPEYEAVGLAVFPVDGEAKKPAIAGYLEIGTRRSRELVGRFGAANALGFACGKKGRGRDTAITVLDIDEPDENLLADAFSLLGPSPVVIRTASGKFHAWYRHTGEGRKIRGVIPGRAVDVLGNGFALAPPSQTAKGEYEFVQGSLADVCNLPSLCWPAHDGRATSKFTANVDIPVGVRNVSLWRACMAEARHCGTFEQLKCFAFEFNADLKEPLPETDVMRAASSAWTKTEEGQNWFGSKGYLSISHDSFDRLFELTSDAVKLMLILRREHWGRETFFVADAMAASMPGGSWNIKRFSAARNSLLKAEMLVRVRAASMWHGPALFRFGPNAP